MVLTDNLISYWKLDEASGNASDSVGSNTLTNFNSSVYQSGKINNGIYLQASSIQYLQSSSFTIGTTFSLSFWFKVNNGANFEFMFQHGTASGNYVNIAYVSDNKIHYSSFTDEIISDTAFSNNTWTHCVVTNDGSNGGKIYINGSLDKSGTVTKSSATSIATFGRRNDTIDYYMSGMIDEVGIWSRALTADEITTLYNSGNGKQYPFSIDIAVNEVLSLVESVTNLRGLIYSTAETMGLVEAWTTARGKIVTIAETLGLVEATTILHNKIFTIADSLGLVELGYDLRKKWNSVIKSVTSWTNSSKNTTNWSNTDKTDTNWSNLNKS